METFDIAALRENLGITWHEYKNGRRPAGYECVLCGRVCQTPSRYVRCYLGVDTVCTDEFADRPENQSGDMGCYPVGPECIKKILKALEPRSSPPSSQSKVTVDGNDWLVVFTEHHRFHVYAMNDIVL